MSGPVIEVRGGTGGIAVCIDELRRAAAGLDGFAARVSESAALLRMSTGGLGSSPSQLFDPAGLRTAEAAVAEVAGPPHAPWAGALNLAATALGDLAGKLRSAADFYERADGGASFENHLMALGGFLIGAAATVSMVPFLPLLAVPAATSAVMVTTGPTIPGLSQAGAWAGAEALAFLARHPELTEQVLATVPNVLGGVLLRPGLDSGAEVAQVLTLLVARAGMAAKGVPWLLDTGTAVAQKPMGGAAAGARPPAGVAGLLGRIPPTSADPVVRIERIDTPGGRRWIVSIPGTDSWPVLPGRSPFDGPGAFGLAAQRRTAGVDAVEAAMRQVHIPPGEPVMLTGYSQGGMVAAAMVADESITSQFTVTHLVTAAAPIAEVPVPGDVQVLSLELSDDFVPKLDAAQNPDRPSWTTVTGVRSGDDFESAHWLSQYLPTAAQVDASPNPSVRSWSDGARDFLDGPGEASSVSWTVPIHREP